ncbi:MAG TPA: methyltransferase domain-containing protein [Acidimicrobiales bacterium]|nr:methyltransferase domain-containing protein [Acidimicrobiales bacterium]
MTITRTSGDQALDAPAWTGDAGDYDAWFDTPWGRHAFAVEAATVRDACGDLAGRRVLDAGCGTGRFSATLAGDHTPVVGIDPDPAMLGPARARVTGGCARAVVEHLPFPDGAFDLSLAVTVLEFVADPAAALAELARVTRDGGRIVVGALNPRSPWGLANRRARRAGVWCHARFLGRSELRALGSRHGRTRLHGALHAPGALPGLARLGPPIEAAGRAVPPCGAFQVLTIDKVGRP